MSTVRDRALSSGERRLDSTGCAKRDSQRFLRLWRDPPFLGSSLFPFTCLGRPTQVRNRRTPKLDPCQLKLRQGRRLGGVCDEPGAQRRVLVLKNARHTHSKSPTIKIVVIIIMLMHSTTSSPLALSTAQRWPRTRPPPAQYAAPPAPARPPPPAPTPTPRPVPSHPRPAR